MAPLLDPKYSFVYKQERFDSASVIKITSRGMNKIKGAGDYRLVIDGEPGRRRTFFDAKARLRSVLRGMRPGQYDVRVERLSGPNAVVVDKVRFFKTRPAAPVQDTPGPIGLDRVEGFIESKYRGARFAGDCVCKPDSDHRDCAAVDYFDTVSNMTAMREDLMADPAYFHLKYIILFDRIYFFDLAGHFTGSENYTGVFHSHIHVSVYGGAPGAAC